MELARLLALLSGPSASPGPVAEVEVCQTYTSAVFLAGPYVYRTKKPVDLGFLDFTMLQKSELGSTHGTFSALSLHPVPRPTRAVSAMYHRDERN
jgi:hypothetical protein